MGIFPHGLHGPGLCCIIRAKVTIPPQEDIMADYQEYRRRILHRRWRRMFITAALLILLVLLAAVGVLWKRLHREPAPNTAQGPTILQQELTGSEWNTISYGWAASATIGVHRRTARITVTTCTSTVDT